jgi:hypothetical protein
MRLLSTLAAGSGSAGRVGYGKFLFLAEFAHPANRVQPYPANPQSP